jgi:uncharacterized membrane protein YccC
MSNIRIATLVRLGIALIVAGGAVRFWLTRTAPSTDAIDFVLGAVVGIGIALLILAAWRSGRQQRMASRSS